MNLFERLVLTVLDGAALNIRMTSIKRSEKRIAKMKQKLNLAENNHYTLLRDSKQWIESIK